jgi:hypothetical protein
MWYNTCSSTWEGIVLTKMQEHIATPLSPILQLCQSIFRALFLFFASFHGSLSKIYKVPIIYCSVRKEGASMTFSNWNCYVWKRPSGRLLPENIPPFWYWHIFSDLPQYFEIRQSLFSYQIRPHGHPKYKPKWVTLLYARSDVDVWQYAHTVYGFSWIIGWYRNRLYLQFLLRLSQRKLQV